MADEIVLIREVGKVVVNKLLTSHMANPILIYSTYGSLTTTRSDPCH